MDAPETMTHEIPKRIWSAYFDGLSRMYQGWACNVQLLSMDLGDQPLIEKGRLWALSFERAGTMANSILIETGDPVDGIDEHWAVEPVSVREANTKPGFEADIQIECADGSVAIIRIQRRPELPPGRSFQEGAARFRAGQARQAQQRWFRAEHARERAGSPAARARRAQVSEPRTRGSLLMMVALGAVGVWVLSRMLGERPRASLSADRADAPPSRARSWPTRS